jgi:hypothetical protein
MVSVVFLGLVQNIAHLIPHLEAFLAHLESEGITTSCIFGENGSIDGTREGLRSLQRPRVEVLDTSFMANIKGRLERMAIGREALQKQLDYARCEPDFVCVVDWDVLLPEGLTADAFSQALRHLSDREDLYAVSATSRPTYYDLLAYEDEDMTFADLPKASKHAQRNFWAYYRLYFGFVFPAQKKLTRNDEVLAISAFNGLCIYKTSSFKLGSYTGSGNFEICEHLNLHRSIANARGQRVAILPTLCLVAPDEHIRKNMPLFVLSVLMKLLKRTKTLPSDTKGSLPGAV